MLFLVTNRQIYVAPAALERGDYWTAASNLNAVPRCHPSRPARRRRC